MMRSDRYKGAPKAFENADKILKKLIADKPDDQLYRSRSVVLDRLGLIADCTQRPDLACQYYQEMVDSPEVSRCAGADRLFVANQVLAIDYGKVGNKEASLKYFDAIEKTASEGKISPEKAIPLLVKRIHARWASPNDKSRIQALDDLWWSEKYKSSPEILPVGDELLFYYFFGKPPNKEKFEKLSSECLARLDGFRNTMKESELTTRVPQIVSIRQSLLTLLADYHQGRVDLKTAERFVKSFHKDFAGRDPQFSVPDSRPEEQLTGIFTIYQRVMVEHWKASQQRQNDLKDL